MFVKLNDVHIVNLNHVIKFSYWKTTESVTQGNRYIHHDVMKFEIKMIDGTHFTLKEKLENKEGVEQLEFKFRRIEELLSNNNQVMVV